MKQVAPSSILKDEATVRANANGKILLNRGASAKASMAASSAAMTC
jgi:hypothetical protein